MACLDENDSYSKQILYEMKCFDSSETSYCSVVGYDTVVFWVVIYQYFKVTYCLHLLMQEEPSLTLHGARFARFHYREASTLDIRIA
jgi:hypothetical protein